MFGEKSYFSFFNVPSLKDSPCVCRRPTFGCFYRFVIFTWLYGVDRSTILHQIVEKVHSFVPRCTVHVLSKNFSIFIADDANISHL